MEEKAAHPTAAMKQRVKVGRVEHALQRGSPQQHTFPDQAPPSAVPRLPMAYSKFDSISGLGQSPQGLTISRSSFPDILPGVLQ